MQDAWPVSDCALPGSQSPHPMEWFPLWNLPVARRRQVVCESIDVNRPATHESQPVRPVTAEK